MNEQLEQQARAFIARRATVSEFLTGLAATGWSKSDIDEAYARFKDDLQPDPTMNEEVTGNFIGGTNPDAVPQDTPTEPTTPPPVDETAASPVEPSPTTPEPEPTPESATEIVPPPVESSEPEQPAPLRGSDIAPPASTTDSPSAPAEPIQPPEIKTDQVPPPPAPTPTPPPSPPRPEPEPPRAAKAPADYLRNGALFAGIILAFTLQYSLVTFIASKLFAKQIAEIILMAFGNPIAGAFALYAVMLVLLLLATPATLLLFHKVKQRNAYGMTGAAIGVSLFLGFRLFDLLTKLVPKSVTLSSGFITDVVIVLLAYVCFLIIFTVCKLLYDHLPRALVVQIGVAVALTLVSFGVSSILDRSAVNSLYRDGAKTAMSEIDGDIYAPKAVPSQYNLTNISKQVVSSGYVISFTSGKSLVDGIEFQVGKRVEAYDYIIDCLSGEETDQGMGMGKDCDVDRSGSSPLVTVTQDDYFYIFQKVGDEARLLRASSTISKEVALKAFKSVEKVDRAKFTKTLEKGMAEAAKSYKESAKKGGAIIDDTDNP